MKSKEIKIIRILYDYQIISMQEYGGISRYFFEIISRLSKHNECEIFISAIFFINHYFIKYFKLSRIRKLPSRFHRYTKVINRLYYSIVSKNNFDIIHSTYYNPSLISKLNCKSITTIHDMIYELYPNELPNSDELIRRKKQYIYTSDKIIAVSECTKRDIMKFYPDIPKDKITVIYHGSSIKFDSFTVGKLELPTKYILFMGNRGSYKNFINYIRAVAPIVNDNEELCLLCVGGGAFNDEEDEIITNLGIKSRIKQINYDDDDLPYVYNKALCFVYPSKYEGFGIPILEAWSCDCPIAISNASCFPEIAGDAAVYFNPNDIEEMKQMISDLLYNETLKMELIRKGKERLIKYDWSKAAQQTLDVYKSLLSKSI
jgi:glycosyltransferase involved in cell wall biosynthesis